MKGLFLLCFLTAAFSSKAAIYKSYYQENECMLFRNVDDEQVKTVAKNEIVVFPKTTYGISFEKMDINFDSREVKVQVMINVTLGLNRMLVNSKSTISETHPEFQFLVNQLNRKIQIFEKVCLGKNNEVVFAKLFPPPAEVK